MESTSPVPVKRSWVSFVIGTLVGATGILAMSQVASEPLKAWFPGFGNQSYWEQARQASQGTTPTPTPTPTTTPALGPNLTTSDLRALLRAYLDAPERCPTGYCSGGLVNSVIYGIISGPSNSLQVTFYTYAGDHKAPYDATKWVKHVESVGDVQGLVSALGQCEMGAAINGSTMGCPQNPQTEFCSAVLANGGGMAKDADDPACQEYEDNPEYHEYYNSPYRLR